MQAVDNNILIRKVNEYINNNIVLLENDVVSRKIKKQIINNEFKLDLDNIDEYTINQKFYLNFILLEVRDSINNLIGFRITTDKDEFYQFSRVKIEKENGNYLTIENYSVNDLIVEVCKNNKDYENITIITSDDSFISCSHAKEVVEYRILYAIEKLLGNDEIKVYQIQRKKVSIPRFNHNIDNIIDFVDRKHS